MDREKEEETELIKRRERRAQLMSQKGARLRFGDGAERT